MGYIGVGAKDAYWEPFFQLRHVEIGRPNPADSKLLETANWTESKFCFLGANDPDKGKGT